MGETIQVRDGRELIIRSAIPGDGQRVYDFMYALGDSTDRLLTHPGDMRTVEQYESSITQIAQGGFYSLCAIDPETDAIVGNAAFYPGSRVKIAHAAGMVLGVLPQWQGCGLGVWLLNRSIEDMRKNPKILRLDLLVMDGNDHAKKMYERVGFKVEGHREKAVRQPSGELCGEYMMGMWIGNGNTTNE